MERLKPFYVCLLCLLAACYNGTNALQRFTPKTTTSAHDTSIRNFEGKHIRLSRTISATSRLRLKATQETIPTNPDGSSLSTNTVTLNNFNITAELAARNIVPHHSTSVTDIFCNREINMQQIQAIGFDMDYTLAAYKKEFELLAYNGAKEKLVEWLGYPHDVTELSYELNICRRGCLIDKKRGNILKLDKHRYLRAAEHGLTPMSSEDRKGTYRASYQESESFSGPEFVNIDTPFSLVDACLFAQLVDMKDHFTANASSPHSAFWASRTYSTLWTDLRRCVDRCHKDGVIKLKVAEDPQKYIVYDPKLFSMLAGFRKAKKKVFLLTNSLWEYTHVVMNYLQGRKAGEDKDFAWTEYFDLIFVGGNKPAFLLDDRLSLYRLNPKDGSLQNLDYVPQNPAEVDAFLRERNNKFFQGGNYKLLHRLLGLGAGGDRLLYVGDHIYSDVLRSKRSLGWRTCLIVPELPQEIIAHKKHNTERLALLQMRRVQYLLENKRDRLQQRLLMLSSSLSSTSVVGKDKDADKLDYKNGDKSTYVEKVELDGVSMVESVGATDHGCLVQQRLQDEIADVTQTLAQLQSSLHRRRQSFDARFHARWGPLFTAGFQESRIAKQIQDYACIYTAKASNLGQVSPLRPLRPSRDTAPHDLLIEGL